jgi:casein kinase 1
MAANRQTGQHVAIKMEPKKDRKGSPVLYEARVLAKIAGKRQKRGAVRSSSGHAAEHEASSMVPQVHWSGVAGDFNVMVMDLLGPTLQDMFTQQGRRYTWELIARIGVQIIDCVEFVHSRNFIHRDINPQNIVYSLHEDDRVQLIDFGFAKKFRNSSTKEHIACELNRPFLGNMDFASVNAHYGMQQSRRDDMESLGYVLLYLGTGDLPWMSRFLPDQDRLLWIKCFKSSLVEEELCQNAPKELAKFLKHCRKLSFEQPPDYAYLRRLMQRLAESRQHFEDYNFVCDWAVLPVTPRQATC